MTAAKIMDIISRLPGCDGQAADAVSACTQVKMEDAHKIIQKIQNRSVQTFGTTQMAKILVQHGRHSRSSWAESARSSFGRTIVGKAIWDDVLLKHGWEKIPNWECLFVHREKGLFSSVHVDDRKLATCEDDTWTTTTAEIVYVETDTNELSAWTGKVMLTRGKLLQRMLGWRPTPSTFSCLKTRFQTLVCSCFCPQRQWYGTKNWRWSIQWMIQNHRDQNDRDQLRVTNSQILKWWTRGLVQIQTLWTPQTWMRNDLESDLRLGCTWNDHHPQASVHSKQHEHPGHRFTLLFQDWDGESNYSFFRRMAHNRPLDNNFKHMCAFFWHMWATNGAVSTLQGTTTRFVSLCWSVQTSVCCLRGPCGKVQSHKQWPQHSRNKLTKTSSEDASQSDCNSPPPSDVNSFSANDQARESRESRFGKHNGWNLPETFCERTVLEFECRFVNTIPPDTEIHEQMTMKMWVILAHMCVKLQIVWVHFGSILGPFWVHFACCLSGDAFWKFRGSISIQTRIGIQTRFSV